MNKEFKCAVLILNRCMINGLQTNYTFNTHACIFM